MMQPPESAPSPWGSGRRAGLVPFLVLTVLISILLLVDVTTLVRSNPNEVFGHVVASAGFTIAAAGTLLLFSRSRPPILGAMVAGVVITIMLEIAQIVAPARRAELDDLTAGLAGVLLASMVIEIVMTIWSQLTALRIHIVVASMASLVLLAILVPNWTADTIQTARPDGVNCPTTPLTGAGERLTIGEVAITNSCLRTESGGLGLVGSSDSVGIEDDVVLVTSELTSVVEMVAETGRLVVRTEIVTEEFGERGKTGTVAMLVTQRGSQVLHIRASGHRLDVLGPTNVPLRALAYAQTFEPGHRHLLEVELGRNELRVRVDGDEVSHTTFDPGWIELVAENNLQLLIGNNVTRTLPFGGTVEWIEIDS